VILHTNLGPRPRLKIRHRSYIPGIRLFPILELDLESRSAARRLNHAEDVLKNWLGVRSGGGVNNNAPQFSGAFLHLHREARDIARSQLVETGGGFRVPGC